MAALLQFGDPCSIFGLRASIVLVAGYAALGSSVVKIWLWLGRSVVRRSFVRYSAVRALSKYFKNATGSCNFLFFGKEAQRQ